MRALISLVAVLLLVAVAYGMAEANMRFLLGVVIPYAAVAVFIFGMIARVLKWGSSPVPFRIPTTCGQQKSLPWIKQSKLESPSGTMGVLGRMALEVFFFRSLFRNLKMQRYEGNQLAYGEAKWLWLAGLAFHWTFLVILLRHLRFFTLAVPVPVQMLEGLDSFLQIGAPILYITDVIFLAAVTGLFIRRVMLPQVRYISLMADYFPLFLILGIGVTGVMMRYLTKTDILSVKILTMSLVRFSPDASVLGQIGVLFYIHLFLISVLFLYFPFSKLVHMAGVFMSPTRNLAANNRWKRHINPWNYPVHVHTYEEYENDFRAKMKEAGLPVEKE
ncbi:MAG: menaquinol oxidoreductase [Nitrospirae bacterium GWD2_57_9]|nr:MAG: menaquinol oxidoreductase [Nitrospirae bacterium GWD2_57_9]OGW48061.1 MAG: menaquinol oxidoreductase [Nitrospirae bacterium GWC2_57_9]